MAVSVEGPCDASVGRAVTLPTDMAWSIEAALRWARIGVWLLVCFGGPSASADSENLARVLATSSIDELARRDDRVVVVRSLGRTIGCVARDTESDDFTLEDWRCHELRPSDGRAWLSVPDVPVMGIRPDRRPRHRRFPRRHLSEAFDARDPRIPDDARPLFEAPYGPQAELRTLDGVRFALVGDDDADATLCVAVDGSAACSDLPCAGLRVVAPAGPLVDAPNAYLLESECHDGLYGSTWWSLVRVTDTGLEVSSIPLSSFDGEGWPTDSGYEVDYGGQLRRGRIVERGCVVVEGVDAWVATHNRANGRWRPRHGTSLQMRPPRPFRVEGGRFVEGACGGISSPAAEM